MKQHVAHDQVAVRYADGIDHVWSSWEPSLRTCERLFGAYTWRCDIDADDLAAQIRRAQYRAHTAAEFSSGLVPPPSALEAHAYLLGTLGACRDALGVLAVRAELDELTDDVAELGLHAVDATRDAFRGARSTSVLVQAWVAEDRVDPSWLQDPDDSRHAWTSTVVWGLVALCALLLTALVLQVVATGLPG